MSPAVLRDGDYVVFSPVLGVPKPAAKLEDGRTVFVRVGADSPTGEGVTVGRYFLIPGDDARVQITKDNRKYPPIVVAKDHIEQLAVAVEIRTKRGL